MITLNNVKGTTLEELRTDAETKAIRAVLKECAGNVAESARFLGVGREGLYAAMARLEIKTGTGRRKK